MSHACLMQDQTPKLEVTQPLHTVLVNSSHARRYEANRTALMYPSTILNEQYFAGRVLRLGHQAIGKMANEQCVQLPLLPRLAVRGVSGEYEGTQPVRGRKGGSLPVQQAMDWSK